MPKTLQYPLLVIDAGNTAVKFAMVGRRNTAPKFLRAVPTAKLTAAVARRTGAGANSVCIASVVPAVSRLLERVFPKAEFIGPRTKLGFDTKADRKTIGSDRLANVTAAHARHRRNVIVACFGTAATFDIVDKNGVHLGGAIAPGWSAFAALAAANTAQLPRSDRRAPANSIGRRTRSALRSGINGGYATLVAGLIARMKKEAKAQTARVVFTGGDAQTVAKLTGMNAVTVPLLTLHGIAIIAEAVAREARK